MVYSKLCKLCNQLNRAYEIQLLLTLVKNFVEVTTWLAKLLDIEDANYELEFLLNVTVAGFNLFVIFQICYFCHITVLEVATLHFSKKVFCWQLFHAFFQNNRCNLIIFNIINDVMDEEIKDEASFDSVANLFRQMDVENQYITV